MVILGDHNISPKILEYFFWKLLTFLKIWVPTFWKSGKNSVKKKQHYFFKIPFSHFYQFWPFGGGANHEKWIKLKICYWIIFLILNSFKKGTPLQNPSIVTYTSHPYIIQIWLLFSNSQIFFLNFCSKPDESSS